MEYIPMLFQSPSRTKKTVEAIIAQNDVSRNFGLELTERQAKALVECRNTALRDTGRIETNGEVITKLIYAFCDSPYVSKDSYEQTLRELLELFYVFKNETDDKISDDDLIEFMKTSFDGDCFGSIELLAGRNFLALREKLCLGRKAESNDKRPSEQSSDGADKSDKTDKNAFFAETTEEL